MSAFTPHPTAPAAIRVIQRTMYFQVGLAVVFGGISASHRGNAEYYQPNGALLAIQFLLAAAVLGCAVGIGRLQPWSLPASYVVEIASVALGLYSFADSHSGLSAGFIIAGFNIYRLSQANVQQALKTGANGQYGGPAQPPFGVPGQPPFGQAPYGQAPYGQAPYGQAPSGGQPPYGAPQVPMDPETDYYGRPIQP